MHNVYIYIYTDVCLYSPLKDVDCSSKQNSIQCTEFHNPAIHENKLLTTSLPQHLLQIFFK